MKGIRIIVEGSCVMKIGGRHLKDEKFESEHGLHGRAGGEVRLRVEEENQHLDRYSIKTDRKGDAVKDKDGSFAQVMHHVTIKGLGNSFPDQNGKRMLQKGVTSQAMQSRNLRSHFLF